jgi:hypothetical protein
MTEINKIKPEVGDTIVVINMLGEPNYSGKTGTIDHIDSMGQIHCKEFGLAVIPEEDIFKIIKKERDF